MSVDLETLPSEARKALNQFPEFELATFNSSGANGYVLLGRHAVLKKNVAIKIYFHEENAIDQEPETISSINHENVLKVYDARRVEKDCSFFLMQSANYGDLSNYLEDYDISLPLAHKLLCQLLAGLSELHRAPNLLVHRDLKPENLLVHDDTIVISDFGSVRRIDKAIGKVPASKHSILYRPPETFGDDGYFNFSSDIYQAGLIGFLLFGGKLSTDLLSHLNEKQRNKVAEIQNEQGDFEVCKFIDECIQKKICSGQLVDWGTLPIYVPTHIKKILRSAMSNTEKRPSTVSEILAHLSRIRVPDWIKHQDGYLLRNWHGNNYLINENEPQLSKKKSKSKKYRLDNSVVGDTPLDIYMQLRRHLNF